MAISSNKRRITTKEKQIVLHETEYWNGQEWKAKQWTTAGDATKTCPAPVKMKSPKGYEWKDNWKIVTTNRDEMGWEYIWDAKQGPCKRRTWLRTAAAVVVKKKKQRRSSIREDWNFKGFGWSFYKSLLFRDSCGVSFRVPLSTNFDWFDRHPAVPSITSSVGMYYPYMAVVFLSCSVNVEWIKWKFAVCTARAQQVLTVLFQICMTLVTLPVWVVHSGYAKWSFRAMQHTLYNSSIPEPPQYSLELQERIGMSVSWRISQARGYEYRLSYWYMCLPTLFYWGRVLSYPFQVLLPKSTAARQSSLLINWIRQHTGSLGLSVGAPIPDLPYCSASLFMSLSGFFYGSSKNKKFGSMDSVQTSLPTQQQNSTTLSAPSSSSSSLLVSSPPPDNSTRLDTNNNDDNDEDETDLNSGVRVAAT